MKGINAYMKHVMEAADDAPLLYFGIPNKILTYSTVRNWFVKVTPKTLLLSSILTPILIIMFIVDRKDWPIGEQIAFCFIPQIVIMPFAWILSVAQGYILPKRVKRRFDEISESAFLGFEKKELGPGYMKLLGQNEEWHLEFYQVNNKNKIDLQAIFKSQVKGQSFSETYLNKQFKSFCETRHTMLKEKSLTEYVTLMPYLIRVTLPMKLKLTADDYRYLYSDIKAFVSSIDCKIIKIDSNR
jgi:hypothetical protein